MKEIITLIHQGEHIQARNNFSDNSDEFNGIGNLVVLDSHINKSIQDDALSEKITEYKNSQYAAVRIEFMKEYESCRDWDIDCVGKRADEEIDKIKRFMDEE